MVVSSGRGCPLSMRPCAGKGAAFFRTFHRSPHVEREGYAAEVGREDWADCLSVWDFLDTRGSAGQDRQTQAGIERIRGRIDRRRFCLTSMFGPFDLIAW